MKSHSNGHNCTFRRPEALDINEIKIPELKVLKNKNYNFYEKYTKKKIAMDEHLHQIPNRENNEWNKLAHGTLRYNQENMALYAQDSPNFNKFKAEHKASLQKSLLQIQKVCVSKDTYKKCKDQINKSYSISCGAQQDDIMESLNLNCGRTSPSNE